MHLAEATIPQQRCFLLKPESRSYLNFPLREWPTSSRSQLQSLALLLQLLLPLLLLACSCRHQWTWVSWTHSLWLMIWSHRISLGSMTPRLLGMMWILFTMLSLTLLRAQPILVTLWTSRLIKPQLFPNFFWKKWKRKQ